VVCYNEALRIKPHYPEALSGLGVALKEAGEIDAALFYFDEALKHKPGYPEARNNRAGALLLTGSLKAGFEDFESRWDRSNAPPKTLISDLPIWEGQKLAGHNRRMDEQGLGDLIQFSRYLLGLADAGADVTLLCRNNMHRLLRTLPKPVRLVEALDSNESFAFQPETKLKLIRDEQAQGKLVAMCGDGTNDAPALAQADVGVAMNTGTMAAREAGNMVDLDSDPTKLIEIVEIGKQLLMTRGALTTFSVANDVAKYFAIIPAMFVAFYPQLQGLNVMNLATPQSAILSAIIFNALIIVALIPLALRGVAYRPVGAASILRRNLLG
jgi:tetratricopeptide (TPR) repeat protein